MDSWLAVMQAVMQHDVAHVRYWEQSTPGEPHTVTDKAEMGGTMTAFEYAASMRVWLSSTPFLSPPGHLCHR